MGSGITKYLSHASNELSDLISKLLIYHPEERLTPRQALHHPFFKEMTDQQAQQQQPKEGAKLSKMASLGNFSNQNHMKSFINDSLSIIKSTDESQLNIKKLNKKEKLSYLPSVKHSNNNNNNIYAYNEQHSLRSKNDSDDIVDENVNNNHNYNLNGNPLFKFKLPKLPKGSNDYEMSKMKMFGDTNVNNINNNYNLNIINNNHAKNTSIEMQNNNNLLKGASMSKKMNFLKKNYISPYSQKMIFNVPKN